MAINILQLIGSFNQGGSERQAVQLVSLLSEDNAYRIFPACLDRRGVLLPEFERLGFGDFPEFPLTSFYGPNMVRQLRGCVKYLRVNQIEIIQTHDFYTNVFGMAAGAMARVPVRIAAKRETGSRSPKQAFFERRAFALAHAIVANAEAVRDHLVETGVSEKKIRVIHNGLDLERFEPGRGTRAEIVNDLGLPGGADLKFITIVANLRSDIKNHRMFLRSAKKVRKNFPGARFMLAGEGELTDSLKGYAVELGVRDDCFFIGRCTLVADLLAVSEVCVLSSRAEGFSNAILEYMAAGKPVVATDVGGAREAIIEGETGYLVSSDDDGLMAERLLDLLENPDRAESFGIKGRKVIDDKFSLTAQLQKTLGLYEDLLTK